MVLPWVHLDRAWPGRRDITETASERHGSLQRSMSDSEWYVRPLYSVETDEDGVEIVRGQGRNETYYPLAYPNLPFELAKVPFGDTEAALEFVHRWGLLGFDRLLSQEEVSQRERHGDPLEFISIHSHTVKNVLALYHGLAANDSDALLSAWDELNNPQCFIDYQERLHGVGRAKLAMASEVRDRTFSEFCSNTPTCCVLLRQHLRA